MEYHFRDIIEYHLRDIIEDICINRITSHFNSTNIARLWLWYYEPFQQYQHCKVVVELRTAIIKLLYNCHA